jgi:hypothetical protein
MNKLCFAGAALACAVASAALPERPAFTARVDLDPQLNLPLPANTLTLEEAGRGVVGCPAATGARAMACGVTKPTGSGAQESTRKFGDINAAHSVIVAFGLDIEGPA